MIDKITNLEEKDIRKISPNFRKFLIRVPLFLFPWASGLLSGITTSFIKGVAEMAKSEELMTILTHPLPYICLCICGLSIVGQLYTMNNGFKYYNQLEVVPIYQSSVIINNILCGGIIFNEFKFYTWWQMLLILTGTLICISGIMVIVKKYSFISKERIED